MSAPYVKPHALSRVGMGFVLLLGVVSLFADMAYEGARSITGPFLAFLGANASMVGFVAGMGEVMGYALRLPFGLLADRTRRYWDITILGYLVNMGAVPLLALAGRWETASALIVAERIGKAVRTPARDAMLAYAATSVGRGWVFGVHEAIDQVGAVAGPLVVAAALALTQGYRWGFGVLAVPAALALLTLALTRWRFPRPLGSESPKAVTWGGGALRFSLPFWLYMAFTGVSVAGYAHFQMMGYHFKVAKVVTDAHIPLLFALAMGVDAVTALLIGRWFDRVGLRVLVVVPLLSLPIAPLAFSRPPGLAVAGVLLWGIVLGAQETVLRAAVASFAPVERRGAAFGVFHTVYGVAWFAGSAAMGALYAVGIRWLVSFSVILEVVALALFVSVSRDARWDRAQPTDGV